MHPFFRAQTYGPLFSALAYFVAALLSLRLTQSNDGIATVWPSSGILLAVLLIAGRKNAFPHVATAAVASICANLSMHNGLGTSCAFTAANMSEALIAAWLCRRVIGPMPAFTNPGDVGRFCMIACAAGLWSALAAAGLSGIASWSLVLSWFTTVILGILIVTPLILTAWKLIRSNRQRRNVRSLHETAWLLLLVGGVSIAVFAQSSYPLLFLPMLFLIAATYRLGPFGATAGVLIVAVIGSVYTGHGDGPLTLMHADTRAIVMFLQFYLLVLLASTLPLAALLASRDALMDKLADAYRRAEDSAHSALAVADTDHLTGLASRRRILSVLATSIDAARKASSVVSIALLDIDHFKSINDRYGHRVGDDVLRRVAQSIRATLRSADLVGRFGGEEFLIVFPGTDAELAMIIAERVREAIEADGTDRPGDPRVTTSIGVACDDGSLRPDELIERADAALYGVKAAGRNASMLAA